MYYGEIKKTDIANGPGVRVSLFVSGCSHHCPGCFNEDTWDFHFGQPYTKDTEAEILDALSPDYVAGLSVLGGEPFEAINQRELLSLFQTVKEQYPAKTIWVYSGYPFDREILSDLPAGTPVENQEVPALPDKTPCKTPAWVPYRSAHCEVTDALLNATDVIVDGKFIRAEKDLSLRFRGSRNQRLIDVPASLTRGEVVLWEG